MSSGYIRGGGGVPVDGRLVARALLWCGLVVLAALVVLLTIGALDQNSRYSRLKGHGVAVHVTVTGCVGQASGTGITVAGYTCRGTFTLGGRPYTEVIGGTKELHQPGEGLAGVTDPHHPSLLASADAVARAHPSWTAFIVPGILLAALIPLVPLAVWTTAHGPGRKDREGATAPAA